MLLPGNSRSGIVEIFPRTMWERGRLSKHYFRLWAAANTASYFRMVQDDAPECARRDFQTCGNVTANVTAVSIVLRTMLTIAPAAMHEQCFHANEVGRITQCGASYVESASKRADGRHPAG